MDEQFPFNLAIVFRRALGFALGADELHVLSVLALKRREETAYKGIMMEATGMADARLEAAARRLERLGLIDRTGGLWSNTTRGREVYAEILGESKYADQAKDAEKAAKRGY